MTRLAYIALHVVLYSAVMLAVTWALWQVMPGVADWVTDKIGLYPALIGMIAIIALCYLIAYLTGRSDSGSARDP